MSTNADAAPAPLVAGMEDAVATEIVDAIKAALAGEDRPFMGLIQRFHNYPRMVSVVISSACDALFNVTAKQRKRIDLLEARAGGTKEIGAVVGPPADAAPDLAGAIAAAIAPLRAELADLAQRVERLETRPAGLKYCGVHDPTLVYGLGDVVTEGGSMFVSKVPTNRGLPGKSSDWQLACKRGRDGRDLR